MRYLLVIHHYKKILEIVNLIREVLYLREFKRLHSGRLTALFWHIMVSACSTQQAVHLMTRK